jgi:DNA-binding transcriptional LysR family regulator
MNIKYRQLKAFSLAAQLSSFTEAASAMSVTPASFSSLIKELENDLGVVLFDRTTRRCLLTDVGRSFAGQLDGALDHMESHYREMKETGGGQRGRLAIATVPSVSLAVISPTLAGYRNRYPQVQIFLSERRNDEVFAAVRDREVELGMGSMLKPDGVLTWRPVLTDRLMLFTPVNHPLSAGPVGWRALEAYPYIMMSTGPAEHAIRVNNLRVQPVLEVDHVATAVAMVRHGLGITALPSSVIPALNLDGVACVPIEGRLAIRTLGVAYRKASVLSKAASNFIELLERTVAADSSHSRAGRLRKVIKS